MERAALSERVADRGAIASVASFAVADDDQSYHLTFLVEGIHCASCIQLIENALYGEPDVVEARVNMSTNRLTIRWKGAQERGDALAALVTELGYKLKPFDAETAALDGRDELKFLLWCIAVAGFAAGNMMLISVGLWTTTTETMGMATRDLFHWLSALIALPTIIYSGRPFFSSAIEVLKRGHANMDVPISLAVILAGGMSLFETIRHGEHVYFDSAVMLLFFLLIGRYLDAKAKGKARESAKELLSMLGGSAIVLTCCGKQKTVPIKDLREGMVVMVAMGANIPADGVVSHGETELDMSLLTGETMPQHVTEGERVFAGTTNLSAPIQVTISKASKESLLSDIVTLMEKAEQGQAKYVRLADRAAQLYTPIVHSMGALTFFGWWLGMGADWQPSLLHAITVLIITCPCALGLAVPVVQVLASGRLMKHGILLKSGDALEKLAAIDVAAFDKTGTLTLGKPELLDSDCPEDIMAVAASLAAHSTHPLSQALTRAYDGPLLDISDVREIPGMGIEGIVKGVRAQVGSRKWCGDHSATDEHTRPELWLAIHGEPPRRFTFSDPLREDAVQVIQQFHEGGIRTILLSGDRLPTVEYVAGQLGITEYYAGLTPVEKCEKLEALQADGHKVLMVGDGLNDAPSLATASVSISPSTAMDITQNTADVVFQGRKLGAVADSWNVARDSTRLVTQNFALAVIYNLFAIPLAVMGYVTPLIAAIAMSASSLVVIGNSFRLQLRKDT